MTSPSFSAHLYLPPPQHPAADQSFSSSSHLSISALKVKVKVAQSSLDFLPSAWPVACQAPLSMKILQARILEWVAMPSSRVFPTQGLNAGLLHCRWILYHLSHKGSPRILEWVAYRFSKDLPDPGIKLGSPALQAESLPIEPPGKPLGRLRDSQFDLCP